MRYLTSMDIVEARGVNCIPKFSTFKGSSTSYAILALAKPSDYENEDNWKYATYRGDWQKRGENYVKFEVNCSGADIVLDEHKPVKVYLDKFTNQDGTQYEREKLPISKDVEYNEDGRSGQLMILEQMSKGIDSKGKYQPDTNFKDAFKTFCVVAALKESYKHKKAVYIPKYWKNLPL